MARQPENVTPVGKRWPARLFTARAAKLVAAAVGVGVIVTVVYVALQLPFFQTNASQSSGDNDPRIGLVEPNAQVNPLDTLEQTTPDATGSGDGGPDDPLEQRLTFQSTTGATVAVTLAPPPEITRRITATPTPTPTETLEPPTPTVEPTLTPIPVTTETPPATNTPDGRFDPASYKDLNSFLAQTGIDMGDFYAIALQNVTTDGENIIVGGEIYSGIAEPGSLTETTLIQNLSAMRDLGTQGSLYQSNFNYGSTVIILIREDLYKDATLPRGFTYVLASESPYTLRGPTGREIRFYVITMSDLDGPMNNGDAMFIGDEYDHPLGGRVRGRISINPHK